MISHGQKPFYTVKTATSISLPNMDPPPPPIPARNGKEYRDRFLVLLFDLATANVDYAARCLCGVSSQRHDRIGVEDREERLLLFLSGDFDGGVRIGGEGDIPAVGRARSESALPIFGSSRGSSECMIHSLMRAWVSESLFFFFLR